MIFDVNGHYTQLVRGDDLPDVIRIIAFIDEQDDVLTISFILLLLLLILVLLCIMRVLSTLLPLLLLLLLLYDISAKKSYYGYFGDRILRGKKGHKKREIDLTKRRRNQMVAKQAFISFE